MCRKRKEVACLLGVFAVLVGFTLGAGCPPEYLLGDTLEQYYPFYGWTGVVRGYPLGFDNRELFGDGFYDTDLGSFPFFGFGGLYLNDDAAAPTQVAGTGNLNLGPGTYDYGDYNSSAFPDPVFGYGPR